MLDSIPERAGSATMVNTRTKSGDVCVAKIPRHKFMDQSESF